MIINDVVHGRKEIKEPVLVELIQSKAMQRMKGICQQGVPEEYILKSQPSFCRYDHCVGTMLILKKLGASLEEQAAGLLHDVSHTAFSHVVDYVFGGGEKEDYQDSIHHTFFGSGTELAGILEKHGMNPEDISDFGRYSLLEQEQPEMCADRFDYTTRYWTVYGDRDFAKSCLNSAAARSGIMAFTSRDAAHEFAVRHTVWQPEWAGWGGTQFDMRIRWYLFGEALRIAMQYSIVELKDFMGTDAFVMRKIDRARNPVITKIFKVLRKPLKYKVSSGGRPRLVLHSKFRYVDPLFMDGGEFRRLSDVDKRFVASTESHRRLNKIGIQLESIEGIDIPINNEQS
jgi:hypothetical protein